MNETRIPPIDPKEEIDFMNLDTTDFSSLGRAEQIRRFEVEGYVVFPAILKPDDVARIKSELADAEMSHASYSVYQTRAVTQPQWVSRAVTELIGYSPMIEFLADLMGPEIVFTRGFFQRTLPGSPGISIHTDGQPHGSNLFGSVPPCRRWIKASLLVEDLESRGMLDDISVVVWGEFGRTPKINSNAGRDHWPTVAGALLAGGGMRTGQVIGSANRYGETAKDRPVHFRDVFATLYHQLDIDLERTQFKDFAGRPHYLLDDHKPIPELV